MFSGKIVYKYIKVKMIAAFLMDLKYLLKFAEIIKPVTRTFLKMIETTLVALLLVLNSGECQKHPREVV